LAGVELLDLEAALIPEAAGLLAQCHHPADPVAHLPACVATLQRLLQTKEVRFILARPAGFIALTWGFSVSRGVPILRVQDLFVVPEHRRGGVAEALLRCALEVARERGANRLHLETDTDNAAARSLYEKVGFEWFPRREVYMYFL